MAEVSAALHEKDSDPVAAFRDLAEAADGQWDGIDAEDYQRRVRGGRRQGIQFPTSDWKDV